MIYLHVACNDPDNGLFTGRATSLCIGEAEFESNDWQRGCAFHELEGAIRLAGKRWDIAGSKEWVGNWCWNKYELYLPTKTTRWYMVDFVTWLRGRSLFKCTGAPTMFYNWFNSDTVRPPKDVHSMVCGLE